MAGSVGPLTSKFSKLSLLVNFFDSEEPFTNKLSKECSVVGKADFFGSFSSRIGSILFAAVSESFAKGFAGSGGPFTNKLSNESFAAGLDSDGPFTNKLSKIGRASCRERV